MDGHFLQALTTPALLGWHFSGTVEKLATRCQTFKLATRFWGICSTIPALKKALSPITLPTFPVDGLAVKPKDISHTVAAAATTEGMTALKATREVGGLSKGKSMAASIAKKLGADATAIYSTQDVERVKSAGTNKILDRSTVNPLSIDAKFDIIFDAPFVSIRHSAVKCLLIRFLEPGTEDRRHFVYIF
jgi:NADPH:quinone reductase-like Zn-dependent oxidoreductase